MTSTASPISRSAADVMNTVEDIIASPATKTQTSVCCDPSPRLISLATDGEKAGPLADAPLEEESNSPAGLSNYFRIFTLCDRLDIALYVVAGTATICTGATLPLMTIIFGNATGEFIDFISGTGHVTPEEFRSRVDWLVLWFVYLFVARFILAYIANVCAIVAGTRTTRRLRKLFLNASLRQEVWYFDKAPEGSISTQVTTNGNRISQGISDKLVQLIQGLAMFLSAFIVALAVQWKLALIIIGVVPVISIVSAVCVTIDALIEAKVFKFYSKAAVLAQECLTSIKTVHAFWAHNKMTNSYGQFLEEAYSIALKKGAVYAVLFSVEFFCMLSATALAYWEGYRMWSSGEIPDVGTVFNVVLAINIGATAMSVIAPQWSAITNASSAAAELWALIDRTSLLDPLSDSGLQPHICTGTLQLHSVSFSYPSRSTAQILHDLSISIPAGRTTALVGASGCGKSTLVGLLERWYVPDCGDILLDGLPLSEYNTRWLRSQIRLVQQEPVLFRGTVFENVARGLVDEQRKSTGEAQRNLVIEACKMANAHTFIQELPQGYDTQIGERASMLSGGQKQRIAIARSVISNPRVLLLDEATSALDPQGERLVQDALDKVSANKTTLVIAHKLSTVKAAHNIVVMAHGRVVEQGTHAELLAMDGQYAASVRAQDLGAAEEYRANDVKGEE